MGRDHRDDLQQAASFHQDPRMRMGRDGYDEHGREDRCHRTVVGAVKDFGRVVVEVVGRDGSFCHCYLHS